ncbi:IS21-like element helper ATPase IstB [Crenobacter sp. SG2303]|uniref:IS21-like element helper ATPase IstB n=1 Tax=Crenobacter oryzisoli TaxID=3056844 RepID=A0ABT7XVH2_9NEIS|nr:IS21-like element helper ATPase IstB [Crenobacter sp. SG2303]MDN0077786.1 IS21-like element helper ATPase IstB [Crenobacter sp. SG2303]
MLNHPTHAKLLTLKLGGMATAFAEQQRLDLSHLSFEERLGLLVDREQTERDNRQLARRLKQAKLRQQAVAEDIDYQHPRGLDAALFQRLLSGQWIRQHQNVLLTGPTGVGKSWLASALAHQACRQGYSAHYVRVPRLLEELALGHSDGRYGKLLARLAKIDVLVLDDWGLAVLDHAQRRDLLEILDDRHGQRSTVITSQLPVELWHDAIGDATLADAILDRLVHNAHMLALKGDSLRKKRSCLTVEAAQE